MRGATAQGTRTERDRKQICAYIPRRLHGKLMAERQSLDATPFAAKRRWRQVNHADRSNFGKQPVHQTQGRLPDYPFHASGTRAPLDLTRLCQVSSGTSGQRAIPRLGGFQFLQRGFVLVAWCGRRVYTGIPVIRTDACWRPPKAIVQPPIGGIGRCRLRGQG